MLSQLKIFLDYIGKYDLFDKNETILLAVSGGRDSMAMVNLFHLAGFKIAIAHCNFHLREDESVRDEQFVRNAALNLNIPIHIAHFETAAYAEEHKISIQMAARELRYDFFDDLCTEFGYTKIAIAHHQNDAIETVLLNLIRGTGIAGLHGIKNTRNKIVRPLLCFTRDEIDSFVKTQNIDFVEDSSNASDKYARNKIRLKIVPEMEKINPSLNETLRKNISYFADLEEFVGSEVEKYKSALLEKDSKGLKIRISRITDLKSKNFILSEILMPYGFNVTTIQDLLDAINRNSISGKKFLSDSHQILLDREYLFLQKISEQEIQSESKIGIETQLVKFNDFVIHINKENHKTEFDFSDKNKCYVDNERLVYPLVLRYWETADKFMPFGMQGFKKLSDFFIQEKVPVHHKKNIPILVNGDGKIIWICGHRSDNRFKIGNETKKITTFEIKSK